MTNEENDMTTTTASERVTYAIEHRILSGNRWDTISVRLVRRAEYDQGIPGRQPKIETDAAMRLRACQIAVDQFDPSDAPLAEELRAREVKRERVIRPLNSEPWERYTPRTAARHARQLAESHAAAVPAYDLEP